MKNDCLFFFFLIVSRVLRARGGKFGNLSFSLRLWIFWKKARSSRAARVYSRDPLAYTIARPVRMWRTYVRRLRTYLRRVRWYMEVAPKFPQRVIRLSATLTHTYTLYLSLSCVFSFSPSVFLSQSLRAQPLSSPFLSWLSRFPTRSLHPCCPPTISLAFSQTLIRPMCIPHSALIPTSSPHSRAPSPRGIIKIAVRGNGANGFRDITLTVNYIHEITRARARVCVCTW